MDGECPDVSDYVMANQSGEMWPDDLAAASLI